MRQAAGYEPARQAEAFEDLLARVRAVPGVRAASFSNNGLFGGSDNGDEIIVEGYTPKGDGDRGSSYDAVGPGYFSTLGIPVLAGREITEQDRAGGAQVCVINETFARRFFDGRNPIGLHVTQSYADQSQHLPGRRRGQGLAAEPPARPRSSIASTCRPRSRRRASAASSFIIRPRGDAPRGAGRVRQVIQAAEPRMPVTRAVALDGVDRSPPVAGSAAGAAVDRLRRRRRAARRDRPLRRAVVRRRAPDAGARRPQGARRAARHPDRDDPAGDRLAARWPASSPAAALAARRRAVDREPPLRPVAGGSRRRSSSRSRAGDRRASPRPGCRPSARRASIRSSRCDRSEHACLRT